MKNRAGSIARSDANHVVGAMLVASSVALFSIAVDRGGSWGWLSVQTVGSFIVAAGLLASFVMVERRVRVPLVDMHLFRNPPYVLVTGMGAVSNVGYSVTIFAATLYLQLVRGLSPLTSGVVFLAPSLLVAVSGPLGARLGKHFRAAAVMAGAGVISGCGLLALTFAHGWVAYILAFGVTGLGFGLGWTFANVATQDVVRAERAGEASGVLLTVLVTAGGVGVAAAAGVIALLENSQTMAVRRHLVRRGLMAPLSMSAPWTPPSG